MASLNAFLMKTQAFIFSYEYRMKPWEFWILKNKQMKNTIFSFDDTRTTSCVTTSKPLVIGHRGARGHVAENTVASVKKALELGVDGIEIDVFLCASGELVVFTIKP